MKALNEICKSFSQAAAKYDQVALVQQEIAERLLERLDYLKMVPERILDLGCGTGFLTEKLRKRYPKAHLVALDLSEAMLAEAEGKQGWFKSWSLLAADMGALPFREACFDLVIANQAIHWAASMPDLFAEIHRILKPEGCFMFTTLGPDTFKELRLAWAEVDEAGHSFDFADMHDLGDWLLNASYLDPVIDREDLEIQYQSLSALLASIKAQGVRNLNPQRPAGLMGRQRWAKFLSACQRFQTEQGLMPLSYEVVYGHCWRGQPKQRQQGNESFIPVSQIQRIR